MKIEDIDEVAALRNHREAARKLAARAKGALLDDWSLWTEGEKIVVRNVISVEYLRQAVIEGCVDKIADIDERLRQLGVSAPLHPSPERDAKSLRRDLEMYVRVWIRELGGKLRPKAHLIDALALTTEDLRKRAEAAPAQQASA
jgi:hypothetical protein